MNSQFTRLARKLFLPSANSPPVIAPTKRRKWSIGIYVGTSPFSFRPPENLNPVFTGEDVSDVPADFVADPFMLRVRHTWYMFFEVMNRQTRRGEIGLATSENGMEWTYQQIVLAEPFHLSYPYVFEWMNNCYMIPETTKTSSVRLYKASTFPQEWLYAGTLLRGLRFADSSVIRHAGKWWLFTETNSQMKFDTLRLYYADDLMDPWREHPLSPIVKGNPRLARPAGRPLALGERVIRYAQDCHPAYGTQVRAFEITKLTIKEYHEQEVTGGPILTGSGPGWNKDGMHHIDPHFLEDERWIACVDGWTWADLDSKRPAKRPSR